jgi:hypothetical protein
MSMAAFKVQKVYFDKAVVSPWDEVLSSMQEKADATRSVSMEIDWPLLKVHCVIPESDSHDGYEIDTAYNMAHVVRFDLPDNVRPLRKAAPVKKAG